MDVHAPLSWGVFFLFSARWRWRAVLPVCVVRQYDAGGRVSPAWRAGVPGAVAGGVRPEGVARRRQSAPPAGSW